MASITNLIIGGMIGAAAGILLAPGPGEDTRSAILDASSGMRDMVSSRAGDAMSRAGKLTKTQSKMAGKLSKQVMDQTSDIQRRAQAIGAILAGKDIPSTGSSLWPFLGGIALGMLGGAAIGMIMAPHSGAEMRSQIATQAKQATTSARSQVSQTVQGARDSAESLRQRGEQMVRDRSQMAGSMAGSGSSSGMMNKDVMQGKWKQMRGEIKQKWGRLTDNDIDQAQGNADKLAGLLQEKYGYSHDKAEQEARDFINQHM